MESCKEAKLAALFLPVSRAPGRHWPIALVKEDAKQWWCSNSVTSTTWFYPAWSEHVGNHSVEPMSTTTCKGEGDILFKNWSEWFPSHYADCVVSWQDQCSQINVKVLIANVCFTVLTLNTCIPMWQLSLTALHLCRLSVCAWFQKGIFFPVRWVFHLHNFETIEFV
jgi:hypothetical protein